MAGHSHFQRGAEPVADPGVFDHTPAAKSCPCALFFLNSFLRQQVIWEADLKGNEDATRWRPLLGAKGIATRSKNATGGSSPYY